MFKLFSCIVCNHVLNTFILESLDLHTLKKYSNNTCLAEKNVINKEVCVIQVFS